MPSLRSHFWPVIYSLYSIPSICGERNPHQVHSYNTERSRAFKGGVKTPTALLGHGQRESRSLAHLPFTHHGSSVYDSSTDRKASGKTGPMCELVGARVPGLMKSRRLKYDLWAEPTSATFRPCQHHHYEFIYPWLRHGGWASPA